MTYTFENADSYTTRDYVSADGKFIIRAGKVAIWNRDAEPEGGTMRLEMGDYNGDWYASPAIYGSREAEAVYTTVDWDAENGEDACDWDNPDYIMVGGMTFLPVDAYDRNTANTPVDYAPEEDEDEDDE